MEITTKRTSNGHFDVFADGAKTEWKIINGNLGLSGYGNNLYGIYKDHLKPKWIGSLAKSNRLLAHEICLSRRGIL